MNGMQALDQSLESLDTALKNTAQYASFQKPEIHYNPVLRSHLFRQNRAPGTPALCHTITCRVGNGLLYRETALTELTDAPTGKPAEDLLKISPRQTSRWTVEDSADLYGVQRWGNDYFGVNDEGLVTAKTLNVQVPLLDIVEGMSERGLPMPVLLRIENILDAQIQRLNLALTELSLTAPTIIATVGFTPSRLTSRLRWWRKSPLLAPAITTVLRWVVNPK